MTVEEGEEISRLKKRIVEAYSKLSHGFMLPIMASEITVAGNTVYVKVPESLSIFVGKLIGRGGCNVRTVEQEIGMRIVIMQEKTPEHVEMKKKLKDLLRRVVEDEGVMVQ